MKQLLIISLTLITCLSGIAQMDDSEMQGTYWKYRDQKKKYFEKIGELPGESLVMSANGYNYHDDDLVQSTAIWRDNTITHGYYLAVLATEYRLLN